ncbi:hypothetical protein [Streptomyces griseus]|uniref:hypothetical protein n=1 Tax=Streptomyces griseus TaxID=1911 RepID=UPI0037B62B15
MTFTFEGFPEPKRWTSDHGRLHWVAYGNVVVTCSEHGEIYRGLSTTGLEEKHPWAHRNAALWERNHLRDDHGIDLDQI